MNIEAQLIELIGKPVVINEKFKGVLGRSAYTPDRPFFLICVSEDPELMNYVQFYSSNVTECVTGPETRITVDVPIINIP